VRALASRYVSFNRQMHAPPMAGAWAAWEAKTHRVSGALQIEAGRGMKFISRTLENEGIPVLPFPVDPVNAKTWDEGKLNRLMTDFIEQRLNAPRIAA
jgi:hypothetical protein